MLVPNCPLLRGSHCSTKAKRTEQKPKKCKTKRLKKSKVESICSNLKDVDIEELRVDLIRQINNGYHLRFFEDRPKLWEYITSANVEAFD